MTKEELCKKKISAISLGCDKNRVDLEKMLFLLQSQGFEIVAEPNEADVVIINTCAFILPAKQESISQMIEMEYLKKKGMIEKIVVTGCFSERNFDDLKQNFPSVDAFVRLKNNENIVKIIKEIYDAEEISYKNGIGRVLTTSGSYAFLKIADGCNNACSYCIIPRIRGRYRSFNIDDLVKEAEDLAKRGVKELILVAQDVSRYGEDLYKENKLISLCQKLVKIKKIEKIRLHYLYPEKITDELLDFISNEKKMCNYIDIPLQHIDDKILKSMRRRMGEDETRALVQKIKQNYSNLAIRTTFIVGYPGETRRVYIKLLKFIAETKFDYAGFFPYYREENTASYFMKQQVPEFKKKLRLKKAMLLQSLIARKIAKENLNKEFIAFVDDFDSSTGLYLCHTEKLSPNVDFGLLVEGENIKVGDIIKVKINSFDGENYGGQKI